MIENNPAPQVEKVSKNIWPWILTILIAAWLIGVSILGAGWLISKEVAKQNSGSDQPISTGPVDIEITSDKVVQGNNDAKVTVIEFADYQCPYCGQWYTDVYPSLKSEYIDTGKVKFVYWDFAFLGAESYRSAEAAMCANDQGKYWEYHDKLFMNQNGESQGAFSDDNLNKFASELNLDQNRFSECMTTNLHQKQVEESLRLGTKYNVSSTPTVFINVIPIEGVMPYENYKQIIESELAK